MEFALSTHLFHGERLGRGHLDLIAASGFASIEVFATRTHFDYHDPRRISELRGWLDSLGLRAASMHAPICEGFTNGEWGRAYSNAAAEAARRHEAVQETTAAFAAARTLGCEVMVLHLGLPRGQPIPAGDNDLGAVRRSVEELAAVAAESGVGLALEVIPNDLSTPDALLRLLDDLDLGRTGTCLDFGHAHLMGGAPEAAEALSGHVMATHVHDNRGEVDNHLVPFDGTIDWTATLTAVWKIGYNGRLTFEVADQGNATGVLEDTVRARRRLQDILDELTLPMAFSDV